MKQKIYIFILMAILLAGCKEDEVVPVATVSVDGLEVNASYTRADIIWNIRSAATIDAVVLEYTTDSSFQTYKEERMHQISKTSNQYVITLKSLTNGTNYYIRCRAVNKINSNTSESGTFSTLPYSLADVRTDTITAIDVSSATLHATLLNRGSEEKPIIGFYIATHPNVTEEDSCIIVHEENITDSLHFSYNVSNLEDNVTYYVRAFAKNVMGFAWGKELSFVTTEILLPSVGATTLKYVSYTNAICSSEIISDGRGTISERGFCYSTTANPTIENNKKVNEGVEPVYNSYLSDLTASTTYYVRAYAINSKGVAYGDQLEFTTKAYSLPVVTTSNVTNIKYTTATCGGEVTDDGGQSVDERGICYSTSPNPTISGNKVSSGSGSGTFSCDLTELDEGVTYYVRAYATNSVGTNYGENTTFTTSIHSPNAIYYTAAQKLSETADNNQAGLHIYRFNASIVSHTFEKEDYSEVGEGVIVFDNTLTDIGDHAFYGSTYLYTINLPKSVTKISEYAFYNCDHLSSLEIPNGVTKLGTQAFQGCLNLTSLDIPSSIINIGEYAFSGSGLVSVTIPDGISTIAQGLFYNCSGLSSIELPNSITSIGNRAFYNCSELKKIEIPEGTKTIGYYAFYYCTSASELILSSTVNFLGERAFQGCKGLSSIICKAATPPSCYNSQSYVFSEVSRATLLYVPATSIDKYKSAYVWKEFYNVFPISE